MLATPHLRIRRSEHGTPGRLLCETVHAADLQGLAQPASQPRSSAPHDRDATAHPGPIQNISGVAEGPAVRSVIPWMRGEPTVDHGLRWHKAGEHAPMSDMRRRE